MNVEGEVNLAPSTPCIKYVGQIGRMDPFDETMDDWESFSERLTQFFAANDINDEKKVPALLSLVGGKTYKLLKNLVAPQKPHEKTYDELIEELKKHFSPKPLQIAERYRFHKRVQHDGESIANFVAALKNLSIHCGYEGDALTENLRDRFIVGLSKNNIQKKLLSKDNLTFDRAVEIATGFEQAHSETEKLNASEGVCAMKSSHRSLKPKDRYTGSRPKCRRCDGSNHDSSSCRYINTRCNFCSLTGHIERACLKKKKQHTRSGAKPRIQRNQPRKVHKFDEDKQGNSSSDDLNSMSEINNVQETNHDEMYVTPKINGKQVKMQLDTGSSRSIMPLSEFNKNFPDVRLRKTSMMFKTYTGQIVKPVGVYMPAVKLNGQQRRLPLYIIENGSNSLLGRDWLREIKLNWAEVKAIHDANVINQQSKPTLAYTNNLNAAVQRLINKHKMIFSPGVGNLKDITAKFTLKPNAVPKFVKARTVPFSLQKKTTEELDRLESQGIISKVTHSEWASPICVVPKKNGDVRICADFKGTLNPALVPEQYPLPKIQDLCATFKGQKFSKLDITKAYHCMNVDPEHRKYLCISTHKSLYVYNKLPMGITDASAKWQKAIEIVLNGITNVIVNQDDICITGANDDEHLQTLAKVFARLEEFGLKVNADKCIYLQPSVIFCGRRITANGIQQEEDKIKAIVEAPKPNNVKELRSLLGLINYYHRFVPNVSQILKPLYDLTTNNVKWKWSSVHEKAFRQAKKEIASDRVLVHYDPQLPVHVQCDAGPNGLGVVMSHIMHDKSERPVIFLSRTLKPAEKNYSQLHKEALAIIWGIKKLYHYLYGRHFHLVVDNKPLSSIFHPEKAIPAMTASRLQRYAVFLSGLNYTIRHRPTKEHSNCDALSRLAIPVDNTSLKEDPAAIFQLRQLESIPLSSDDIRKQTRKDPVLSLVYNAIQSGNWLNRTGEFEPFYSRRDELSTHSGVLFWGSRIVIPCKQRNRVMEELHENHDGIVKMKALARSYVWYPGIDREIEQKVKNCKMCALLQSNPPESKLHSWGYPDSPFERIHIDFAS